MDEVSVDEKKAPDEGNAGQQGDVSISNDVIIELAKKTILGISNIQIAGTGLVSKFGIGRKSGDGIRVSSVEDGKIKALTLDIYIKTKYGHRIPDLGLDVQEKVKANLERYTGYIITAVNVNVQGIYVDDPKEIAEATEATEEESAVCDIDAVLPAEEE